MVFYKILVIILLSFVLPITCLGREANIPNKLLTLREETEKGISYFIAKDFTNSIISLSNSLRIADEVILLLSNELVSEVYPSEDEIRSLVVPEKITEKDKSLIITTVRKSTTEAIKFYVAGNVPKSIERITLIKSISLSVIEKANKSLEEIEYRRSLEEKVSSLEKLKTLEKDIISKSMERASRVVYVTRVVTNVKVEEKVVEKRILPDPRIVVGAIVAIVLLTSLVILILHRIRLKKRMKDLSEIM